LLSIGLNEQFLAGAFDSLSAVELSNIVATTLGIKLPGTLVFDYPSVVAIAKHVHYLLDNPEPSSTAQSQNLSPMPLQAFDSKQTTVKVYMTLIIWH